MRYLLILLLVIGMMAPVYAGPNMNKAKAMQLEGRQLINDIVNANDLNKDQKIDILSQALMKGVTDLSIEEAYLDWLIAGIGRALDASPLKVRDSIPPNMENADIPEYLVHQLLNIDAMRRTQNEVIGAKPSPVLYVSVKLTPEEYRKLSNSDDMINFMLNNEQRLFFQVEK